MSEAATNAEGARAPRRRRSDGERSRGTILREATLLATVEGIEGLSISRLAESVGMSKSGLFAHFGSKVDLQLATIETAGSIFSQAVIEPASGAPTGLERLQQLAENFLRHVEDRVFPGGCFFASVLAEMDTRPGPVRDLAFQFVEGWRTQLEAAVRAAQAEGALEPSEDAAQVAFELNAFLLLANAQFVVNHDPVSIERARRALASRLSVAAPVAVSPRPPVSADGARRRSARPLR